MNNFVTQSLAPEQRRAGHLSLVEADAKAAFLDAIEAGDIKRVLVPSELEVHGDRTYRTQERRAGDILIDSATDTYQRQDSLALLLIDGAAGHDIRARCQLFLSIALEQFAQAEVEREEAEL